MRLLGVAKCDGDTADGDSLSAGDTWTVAFETTEGGALAMQLRGTEGETVDLGATQVDAGSGQLVWDGVLPDGSEAADGVYTMAVRLCNYWGEESEERLMTVTVGDGEAAGEAAYDFEIRKASRPGLCWPGGMHKGRTTAGFAHLHFLSHPEWIERLWR